MPSYKQPRSLFQATLTHVRALLDLSCRNIENTYGNYDKSKCRQQVAMLQEYLLLNIPGMILDEVFELETVGSLGKQDIRISLALYMHRNMRKFSVCTWSDYKFAFQTEFLIERLIRMHNLVVLDLYHVCTDEILEAVGTNCHRLEEINILSKVGLVHTTNEMDKAFNALKLKFFVSDVGLFHLRNCKLLRKVTMNRILRSHSHECMMTVAGIRALVKSLPYLQNITYDDMGLVISEQMEDMQQLQLTHLSDFHPRPANIAAAAQLCCSLQHLCLQFPESIVCTATDVLESLANSSLRVPILELIHFPFCIEMAHLLERKGNFLRSLRVESTDYISLRAVHLIGQACQSLRNLHLKQPFRYVSQSNSLEAYKLFHTDHIFHNLRCLHLSRWSLNLEKVLPLCLLQAKQLEALFVTDVYSRKYEDDIMANIISTNPLQELKAIYMHTSWTLSLATVRYLIEHCPRLTVVSVVESANLTSVQVEELCEEVHQKNLDLRIALVKAEPLD